MQVAISLLRMVLFVARPRTTVLGNIPNSKIYRSVDQYPAASTVPGVLILEIDAPIYFANAGYLRERYDIYIYIYIDIHKESGITRSKLFSYYPLSVQTALITLKFLRPIKPSQ